MNRTPPFPDAVPRLRQEITALTDGLTAAVGAGPMLTSGYGRRARLLRRRAAFVTTTGLAEFKEMHRAFEFEADPLAHELSQARLELERGGRQSERAAGLAEAQRRLSASAQRWRGLYTADGSGLSPLVRHLLTPLLDGPQRDFAQELIDPPNGRVELRIPVVATMKAGKSTLLAALIGQDVIPRRSHGMTTVATRYVLDTGGEPALTSVTGAARLQKVVASCTDDRGGRLAGHPHLQELFARLGDGFEPDFSACTGVDEIRSRLTTLNDLARLACLLDPAAAARVIEDCGAEVRVPGRTGAGGRLVLIDTPGPNETAIAAAALRVVRRQLAQAHGCLLVVDYRLMGNHSEAALAEEVVRWLRTHDPQGLWVAVNWIDQRRGPDDPDERAVLTKVSDRLHVAERDLTLVETWAPLGLAVEHFRTGDDPGAWARLQSLVDPLRRDDEVDDPMDDAERERLLTRAARRAGVDLLRFALLDSTLPRLPSFLVELLLQRCRPAVGATDEGRIWMDDVRWALSVMQP